MPRRNILEILKERPVLGDGSYGLTLERRGYIAAGIWTPEAVLTHPEAVKQLHRDYRQAGADVLQAFTFFASDGKLKAVNKEYSTELLNQKACDLVWEVAGTDGPLVCGGISPTPSYTQGKGEAAVKAEFAKQCDIFIKNKVDFLIAEYFGNVEEIEWAIEVMKRYNVPVASTLRIGPTGDDDDVSVGDCAVRMARAGADIVGINCNYDPDTCIKTLKMMKARLDEEGLENFIMAQPLGYHCPETENHKDGYYNLPECPLAMECRLISRWDAARFAREAFDLGVRYIGGCCGFEPYHIRQMSEELTNERGFSATGVVFCPPNCQGLLTSPFMVTVNRATSDYWKKLSKEMSDKRRNLAE